MCMQANESPSVATELQSLRQEVKALHRELDSLAQGTDHPEVKRFACEQICQSGERPDKIAKCMSVS